jgi:alkylation response protein AidB-like acyl-CoA dehydrogenase
VPIWKHQSIGNYLAEMVTKLTAARQLTLFAARQFDSGQRADMEAGMAKLFASEAAMRIALDAVRITAATATPPSSTSSATSVMHR